MLDIELFRSDEGRSALISSFSRRGVAEETAKSDVLLTAELDRKLRRAKTDLQEKQTVRNELTSEIAEAFRGGDRDHANELKRRASALKEEISALEKQVGKYAPDLQALMDRLPNLPNDDVPVGADEDGNVVISHTGSPDTLSFGPRPHDELGQMLGLLNFDVAGRMSGSRFSVLIGDLARLHRALGQFMLDIHTLANGYTEVQPPLLVRDHALYGTGQLPKFSEDLFQTTDGRWLIPTAEVSLTNIVRETTLQEKELPVRYTALTPCFRSEAGAAGRDVRGMFRQHQFDKVELVSIVKQEDGERELELMRGAAETVLRMLELPFRTVLLCTGDMGFSARKTYDLEVWMPSQGKYREISSISLCGDFQARRMKARYRTKDGDKFVYTLNGSGVAVGRALIAVMENYQNEDGSITVPRRLRDYLGGVSVIGASS